MTPAPPAPATDRLGRTTMIVSRHANGRAVCRDLGQVPWWARSLAAGLARREARALQALAGLEAVPRLLGRDHRRLLRSFMAGEPMRRSRPRDPAYFRQALRLLRRIHRRGVAHNDLAKEDNWLVRPDGGPALIDFELAWQDGCRGRIFRMLAREDLRHMLKHKRYYCADRLTTRQRRILARSSLLARAWALVVRPVVRALAGTHGTTLSRTQSDRR